MRGVTEKPITNSLGNDGRLNTFTLREGTNKESTLAISIHHYSGSFTQCNTDEVFIYLFIHYF